MLRNRDDPVAIQKRRRFSYLQSDMAGCCKRRLHRIRALHHRAKASITHLQAGKSRRMTRPRKMAQGSAAVQSDPQPGLLDRQFGPDDSAVARTARVYGNRRRAIANPHLTPGSNVDRMTSRDQPSRSRTQKHAATRSFQSENHHSMVQNPRMLVSGIQLQSAFDGMLVRDTAVWKMARQTTQSLCPQFERGLDVNIRQHPCMTLDHDHDQDESDSHPADNAAIRWRNPRGR